MDTTIRGSAKRGNGLLNNELYIGKLVWNRQRFIKEPNTGKRVSRLNPREQWVVQDVPSLRIVDHETWEGVKGRQAEMAAAFPGSSKEFWDRRRPKHLFSGLIVCAACGGGYATISKTHLGKLIVTSRLLPDHGAVDSPRSRTMVLGGLKHGDAIGLLRSQGIKGSEEVVSATLKKIGYNPRLTLFLSDIVRRRYRCDLDRALKRQPGLASKQVRALLDDIWSSLTEQARLVLQVISTSTFTVGPDELDGLLEALDTGLTPEQQEIVRKVFLFYRSPAFLNEAGLLQLEDTGFAEWEIKLKRASQGWKWYDAPVNQQQLKLLRDIISSDNVTVHHARVPGQKFTVSAAQREQMKIVLDVFFEQGGKVQ